MRTLRLVCGRCGQNLMDINRPRGLAFTTKRRAGLADVRVSREPIEPLDTFGGTELGLTLKLWCVCDTDHRRPYDVGHGRLTAIWAEATTPDRHGVVRYVLDA